MTHVRRLATLVLTTCLLVNAPLTLLAVQPEQLLQKVFDVRVEGGVVDVTFALAMNEISTYPLTITAVGGPVEEILWEGTLSEGFYRLRAPLKKITSGPLKVVLRTKLTNRDAKGTQTYLRYLTWEGTVNR
jgi:hypothetical protein